ncbi:hypothetical protein [Sphingomonas sp. GC_Shp_2]|uniref:hypothetical protein n=1 Tax=Sphingomonas sp. GC_Shp_2 TaxID=2937384 RepID=UPI0022698952|nr:hypothetical protein [Sphingomonas sp. GC_Shp_2]
MTAAIIVSQASTATAQERRSTATPGVEDTGPDIIVTAIRGSAKTDVAPIAELGPDALAAIGAQSVADLNRAIQGQTRSADGSDPITLLNGQRVSADQEIQSLPPEAIEKIEILPEPAALRYGFPPTRRVVNYITKRRFAQAEVRTAFTSTLPTGRATENAHVGMTRLKGDARLTANLRITHSDPLFWSERNIVPDPAIPFDSIGNVTGAGGGAIDPTLSTLAGSPVTIAPVPMDPAARNSLAAYATAANRPRPFALGRTATLLPGTDTVRAETVFGAPVGATMSGSVNLSVEHTLDRALAGPASATLAVPTSNPFSPFGLTVLLNRYLTEAAPLASRNARTTVAAGATLRGAVAGWRWDATLSLNQVSQQAANDQAIDLSAANAAITAGASPFVPLSATLLTDRLIDRTRQRTHTLDAKTVTTNDPIALPAGRVTVTVTLEAARILAISSLRGAEPSDYHLGRTQTEAGVAVNLPLTSRSQGVLPLLGDVSVNASGNIRHVETFGTLADTTLGLTWTPVPGVQLLYNMRRSETAPDPIQLSSPPRAVPNVPVFDYGSGSTQIVTLLLGGNPDLQPEHRLVRSVSLTWKPFGKSQLRISPSYNFTEVRNQTGVLAYLNARGEAVVPDLYVHGTNGNLLSLSYRPINFDFQRQRKLQFSLTSSGRIGSPPTAAAAGSPAPTDTRPSYYVGATPIVTLENRLRLRPGTPSLDLIAGDTIGGYDPRYSGYAYGGVNTGGYGGTLGIFYGGARRIRGDTPASDLRYNAELVLACSAYMPLEGLLPGRTWAKKLQLKLEIANLLDARQRPRDGNGLVPNRLQSDIVDQLGRTATVSLRKLF